MSLRTLALICSLLIGAKTFSHALCIESKPPKQSLAQFAYDMMLLDGAQSGVAVVEEYLHSEYFYFDWDEMNTLTHRLYRNGKAHVAMEFFKKLPMYFPDMEHFLAHGLFMVLVQEGLTRGKKWLQAHHEDPSFAINELDLKIASETLFRERKIQEAKLMGQIFLEAFPKKDDPYLLLARIAVKESDKALALQYLQEGTAQEETISFMHLASEQLTTYQPTILPKDTSSLFIAQGNLQSDTAYLFVQGGPMPALSAYRPRPLSLLPDQKNTLRIDVLQAQMINETVLKADPVLTVEQSLYEHNQSAEMMHRTIEYFKNRGKTVFVIAHSYGCYIGIEYLYSKENLADKLILMGADFDEDLRNYADNEDGTRKFIRWRNGTIPYERDFWDGFPLASLLRPKMEKIFGNTEHLVSAHAKRRFTKLLAGTDLSNVIFYHARFDEANARTSQAELNFLKSHGAIAIESFGDHHSMLTPAYMENIFHHLTNNAPLKKSVASRIVEDMEQRDVKFAIQQYHLCSNQSDFFPISESEINFLGYQLVSEGKKEEALAIFKLNVESFPDSWNCYDSLGEIYLSLGKNKLGEKHYRKSLSLHPGNTYAIKALRSLKK